MANTIKAAENPALANQMLNKALNEAPAQEVAPEITSPSDATVELPGGYITATGEVLRTAEVRELTGKDEEVISKTDNLGKALMTILNRGTVKIGQLNADEKMLDELLIGDRDALLLGILKSTFGSSIEVKAYCQGCADYKSVAIDIDKDIITKKLDDPIDGRTFVVKGKKSEYIVKLPNGNVQKEMINNMDKTSAELSTIILEGTLIRINDMPVYNKSQVQGLSVLDRRTLIEELSSRAPGPQFTDVTVKCPDCEGEVLVPINLGTLFQF